MLTTAKKTPDCKNYVINGEKKWVTQGKWADHGLVAARTGPAGAKGISMFIVPLASKGISRRSIENSGVKSSGRYIFLQLIDFGDLKYEL
jgi:alkylation response protein AidB-like acyl-CoA dehydrogenase